MTPLVLVSPRKPKPGLGHYPTTGFGSNKPRSRGIFLKWGYPDPIGERKVEKKGGVVTTPKKKYLYRMAYVFIGVILLILVFAPMLISVALLGWLGFAVGSAVNDENGGFPGMVIGIAAGTYLVFFA